VLTLLNRTGYKQNTIFHRMESKTTWLQLSQRLKSPRTIPPPIQLKRATWSKNTDDGAVTTFKLQCTPSDTDSLQFELKVHSFETGSVKQYILWKHDLVKLIKGQNLMNAEDKFKITRKVLTGDALSVFQEAAYAQVIKDDNSYMVYMDALALHVSLKNALTYQKAWMQCSENMHKPVKATT
jgi:hypothetical protein